MQSKIVFAYWSQRARGMPIRFLLEYTEANYEEKTYYIEKKEEWYEKDKKTLKPFPNLPYIQDGNFYLTESETIIKYIVKKNPKYHELLGIGKEGDDEFRIDQIANIISELRQTIRDLFKDPNYQEKKRELLTRLQPKFTSIVDFKGDNKFIFPYLTVADFKFTEVLLYYKCLDEELFNQNFPTLNQYITNFYSLPRIAEYVKTERYQSRSELFPPTRSISTCKEFVTEFNKQFIQ